jgi:hypothetical protein
MESIDYNENTGVMKRTIKQLAAVVLLTGSLWGLDGCGSGTTTYECFACTQKNYQSSCKKLTKVCGDRSYLFVSCKTNCCIENADEVSCDEVIDSASGTATTGARLFSTITEIPLL